MRNCPRCKIEKPDSDFRSYDARCPACQKERAYLYHRTASGRYSVARAIAKRRGLTFALTKEEYAALIDNSCHYCHGELDPTGGGLDRLDNKSGYYLGNVVPACGSCNRVKGDDFSYEQMLILGAIISQFRKSHTE